MLPKGEIVIVTLAVVLAAAWGVKEYQDYDSVLRPPCYAVSHGQCIRIGPDEASKWSDEDGPSAIVSWAPGMGPPANSPIDLEDYRYVREIEQNYPTLKPQVRAAAKDHVVTQGEMLNLYVQAADIDHRIDTFEAERAREAAVKDILSH